VLTVDEEGGVTSIVNKHVGASSIAPVKGLLSAPPVLLEGLSLPGEASSRVAGNGGSSVVLGGEDVARAPSDLGAKGSEGLDEDGGLDGHVERSSDLGSLERLGSTELGPVAEKGW